MASRAVAKSFKANWSKLTEGAYVKEIPKINKYKSQVDSTAIKVASLPDQLPKIDWAHYKQHASDPKLVEELEKKYQSIKLEPPRAPASRLNDLKVAKEQDEARFKKFAVIAQSYIESAEVVKQKFKDMIPYREMSFEEYCQTFPEWNFADRENPSLSPHFGRTAGLSREEAAAFEQPDPQPYATKTAWKEWEEKGKKRYLD